MSSRTPSKTISVDLIEASIEKNYIGERLQEMGMSKLDFSRRIGVSYRHANRLIDNEGQPSLLLAYRAAACVGVPIEELFEITHRERTVRRPRVSA